MASSAEDPQNVEQVPSARAAALTAYLERRTAEGFVVESRTPTQAVIVPRRRFLGLLDRLPLGETRERQVVSVDEHAVVTASVAQPRRW